MSLLRSERMGYYSIVMPRENAWEIMSEIGDLSAVEFVDLNQHEQILTRPYSNYIKRCEEMELKIQSIEQTMAKFNRPIEKCSEYKAFLKSQRDILKKRNKADYTYFDEIEHEIEQKLHTLNEQLKFFDAVVDKYNTIIENIHVLEEAQVYFSDESHQAASFVNNDEESKINLGGSRSASQMLSFQYLAGVIDRDDSHRFRRVLFRATLGMVWSNLIDIEPQLGKNEIFSVTKLAANSSNEQKRKTVFLIAYPGGEQNILQSKLNKIADSFGAHKFAIPKDKLGFSKKLEELKSEREDKWKILQITREHINMLLDTLGNPKFANESWPMIEGYRLFVLKEKAIYHNMNKLKQQHKTLQGFFWCPLEMEEVVKNTIESLPKHKPHITKPELVFTAKPHDIQPPTYFRTNDFTAPFQEIVNTYGIPRYQEVNPGLFTIATFPFLFGVMFGDIGHGLVVFVFGLYLCFNKGNIIREKNPLTAILSARYMLAMMGFFALYCGFIYNDFMALPLDIFGTCYETNTVGEDKIVTKKADCVYPFGLDPKWYHTTNELTYFNSFKMKMAIILGVGHMILGTMLKMLNAIHFRSCLDFLFEWLPQIVFLCCTFGYMVVLIFLKWATPYGIQGGVDTSEAPAIINIFIDFALNFGKFNVGTPPRTIRPLYGDPEGKTQSMVQRTLLTLAIICVPLMLLPKPLILNRRSQNKHGKGGYVPQHDERTERIRIQEVSDDFVSIIYFNIGRASR